MRIRFPFVASLGALAIVVASSKDARAGIAWGDATLRGDDVTLEIDANGVADVTHVIAIHVAGKRFRAFNVERVDAEIAPPNDAATLAGLDGPGWPVDAVDGKGEKVEAFVEPTKDHRALHVRFGADGVPRGDYVVKLRYRADLVREGAIHGDGAMASLRWSAPLWPEGFDNGHVSFVFAATGSDPRASIADPGGEAPRPVDGAAIAEVKHGSTVDTLSLTRPHVPHHDDLTWIVSFDRRAIPGAASKIGDVGDRPILPGERSARSLAWAEGALIALVAAAIGALFVRARDRWAAATASQKGVAFRPLVPLADRTRAVVFASTFGAAALASFASHYRLAAAALVAAMIVGLLRAPFPVDRPRALGRWLALPSSGPALPRRRRSLVRAASVAALVVSCAVATAWIARSSHELALVAAMHALVVVGLFASGRAGQLPFDPVAGAWARLAPLLRAIDGANGARTKAIGRMPRGERTIDELRLRVAPTPAAATNGLIGVEIGCAAATADGGAAVSIELLVRMRHGSSCAASIEARLAAARESATFAFSRGRDDRERVLAVRPAFTSRADLARWIAWANAAAEAAPVREQPSRRAA